MGFVNEFKEFAMKGSVVDLAVGVIIGAAFGKIVSSLVDDVIMPAIGYALQGVDFSTMAYTIGKNVKGEAVQIKYGLFINNCIHFIIIALAIFFVIKQINRMKRKPEELPPATKKCPYCMEVVAVKATKCSHCTADIPESAVV